jgi:hypothetical protein
MNFMAPDCVLSNVAVKLDDKWFAIGDAEGTKMAFHMCKYAAKIRATKNAKNGNNTETSISYCI